MIQIYPSPSPSPSLRKTLSKDLAIDTSVGLAAGPTTAMHTKSKRKTDPRRSATPALDSIDRTMQRIVQLDVYAIFLENPKQLLARAPPAPKPKPTPSAVKASAPDFMGAADAFAMNDFKNTTGAPSVSWKGIDL